MSSKYRQIILYATFSVCILVPISIDIFFAALPAISQHFPGENVSLILSMTLLGLASSQLFYGPLLDRFGRRPVLICGLWVYTLSSIVIMITDSFNLFVAARFFQAFGGCSGVVAVLAIARDTYTKDKLVYATSLIMSIIGISPIIAPLIGSFLTSFFNWRASFVLLFILGCIYTLLIQICFKETLLNKNLEAMQLKKIVHNYWQLIKNQNFLVYCFLNGFSYSILFSYLILSPFFIIEQLHFSVITYGWIVALNAVAIIIMARIAPKIVEKITLLKTITLGFFLITLAGILMAVFNAYLTTTIYTFMLPMFLMMIGAGIIRPTVSASAMQNAPVAIAGSAAALFNFITFSSSSLVSNYSLKIIFNVAEFGMFASIFGFCALSITIIKPLIQNKTFKVAMN